MILIIQKYYSNINNNKQIENNKIKIRKKILKNNI